MNDGNRGSGAAYVFAARDPVRRPDGADLEESETIVMSLDDLVDAARQGEVPLLFIVAALGLAVMNHAAR